MRNKVVPKDGARVAIQDDSDPFGRHERHRQFGPLLEFSPDAIVIVDADGLVREWNPAAELMLLASGFPSTHAPLHELLCNPHQEMFDKAWRELVAGDTVQSATGPLGQDDESHPPFDVTVAPIRYGETLLGAVVILRDATGQHAKKPTALARTKAPPITHEPPTPATSGFEGPGGLPGNRWLQRRLSEPPAPGLERGVAVFDIDTFATVTASHGPDVADNVLAAFGTLLTSLDLPGEFAHWRADAFVWTVDADNPVFALDQCIDRLTQALEEPFEVGATRRRLTLSMGLASTTTLGASGDLLAAAKDALQSARQAGGSSAVWYDESMAASATSGFRLASDLRRAIDHDELRLHYQPIMDFATNEISGVEALVRWERPGVGLLAPSAFIGAAERTGQIVSLGEWVVRTACNNALGLGSHSGGPRTMSINISAGQLSDPGLIAVLREAMADGHCLPSTIVIEVTESVLLHDLDSVAATLEAVKSLDVGLDLDDFGTGYSSLQYLKRLPIDRLKIDQGFVAGLGVNSADTAIVASTIALAHALGLRSIAEGVETSEQLALLREMGCDFAQGYLLSRPADMETFTAWLDAYVPADVYPTAYGTAERLARKRGEAADSRDTQADTRDAKADTRDTKANTRDTTATTRDTEANTRDITATTRDTEANTRDATADSRDATADERERVADVRDAAAAARERAEDDRERASGGSGGRGDEGESRSTRLVAEQDRSRATAERKAEASDREQHGKVRDEEAARRAGGANPTAPGQAGQASVDEEA